MVDVGIEKANSTKLYRDVTRTHTVEAFPQ